ncbi:MAG: phosphonate C-P lyase system protein PhnH [Coriobacteriales bacterium]|jgi:alpha-D-ribose 1-methylphosphonate 5-triphosphate synthase subunit PhnH|nr:phosphonate C-P lyase system protein PhnH [Coriobacteriales bacterium]
MTHGGTDSRQAAVQGAAQTGRDFTPDLHAEALYLTQRAFRVSMNAMARPGLVGTIPPTPRPLLANPCLETLVHMLFDSSCGFCVAGTNGNGADGLAGADALASMITTLTYARRIAAHEAQFLLLAKDAPEDTATALMTALSGGTPRSPERGASVLIECASLAQDTKTGDAGSVSRRKSAARPPSHRFVVTGPGVQTHHFFRASSAFWCTARAARGDEFPCGIDLLLIDEGGQLVGLPRTARIEEV